MPKLSPDEKWKRFNKRLEELVKESDFYGLGTTYYQMATFLESEGKDSSVVRKKGYEMKLINCKNKLAHYSSSEVVTEVEVLDAPDSCANCKKHSGKIIKVEEAINTDPIPAENCSGKYGCRCTYLPVTEPSDLTK